MVIKFSQLKVYSEWLTDVKKACGNQDTFDYYSSHYSFETAFKEGMTAKAAFNDCDRWMSE